MLVRAQRRSECCWKTFLDSFSRICHRLNRTRRAGSTLSSVGKFRGLAASLHGASARSVCSVRSGASTLPGPAKDFGHEVHKLVEVLDWSVFPAGFDVAMRIWTEDCSSTLHDLATVAAWRTQGPDNDTAVFPARVVRFSWRSLVHQGCVGQRDSPPRQDILQDILRFQDAHDRSFAGAQIGVFHLRVEFVAVQQIAFQGARGDLRRRTRTLAIDFTCHTFFAACKVQDPGNAPGSNPSINHIEKKRATFRWPANVEEECRLPVSLAMVLVMSRES